MPTWKDINQPTIEDFQIAFNRYMKYFTAKLSSKNVKRLDTNETVIKSADGTTYINGPVLEMRDAATNMRLMMGYDAATSKFVFKLYDAAGNLMIDLNDLGEAVFKGNIETAKNATIGEILKLISPTGTWNSGIQWLQSDGVTLLSRMIRLNNDLLITNYGTGGDVDVTSGRHINLTALGNNLLISTSKIGFFGVTPATRQTVSDPSSVTTTETADSTYSTNEVDMLNHLKTDVTNLKSKLTDLINALQLYGLINN